MNRDLLDSLAVIRHAAADIRREQLSWEDLREVQKLRWHVDAANREALSLAAAAPPRIAAASR